MKIETLQPLLAVHPFFAGLDPEHLTIITGCAHNTRFGADQSIFAEGDPANSFYLIRSGRIALDVSIPGRGHHVVQTVEEGDVLGWSWLFPPHEWMFSARAVEPTRAVAMNGTCLREKCEADPALGYELMKRFAAVMVERLHATRIQLLDVYGDKRNQ
ncbi:MAG: cyclic nucleotide-binding domain-containing protein [Proteobacteria bacterium]|nr:cyclic nucleotide-binding domain-containing protein [Pseudomonadota bacterium]